MSITFKLTKTTGRLCSTAIESTCLLVSSRRVFTNSTNANGKQDDINAKMVESIFYDVKSGKVSIDEAQERLKSQLKSLTQVTNNEDSFQSLESFANLDHTRATRTGFPEAVFASGKTPLQIAKILDDMAENINRIVLEESKELKSESFAAQRAILATRVDAKLYEDLCKIPLQNGKIRYHDLAKIVTMEASALPLLSKKNIEKNKKNRIVVACAGTTDLGVAEEAAVTLEAAGCEVDRIYDVGVAGLHRIINALPRLRNPDVDCVIVCAGMDGALPSVVAGMVSVPVVAVPTSVGYGASFNGISAMLTMLNSCAPG